MRSDEETRPRLEVLELRPKADELRACKSLEAIMAPARFGGPSAVIPQAAIEQDIDGIAKPNGMEG